MQEREKGLWAGLALLIGGLIGVLLGLFYAPQSGKKTRHKLLEKGSDIVD